MGRNGATTVRMFEKISNREVLHIDEFERTRVEVALSLIAGHLAKHLDVLLGLHAFGDDLDLKAVGECDDRGGDGAAVFVDVAARDEGAVDLDAVDGEARDVAHVGESGAEVVDGKTDAEFADALHDLERLFGVDHEQMFGDLQLQLFGLQSAGLESAFDRGRKVFLLKLAGGDVDGNGKLDAEPALQGCDLFAGLKQDPFADGHDKAGLFGEGDKCIWPDQAEF